MTSMAPWSHPPAIFAHGPKATGWLQWLLRKHANISVGPGSFKETASSLSPRRVSPKRTYPLDVGASQLLIDGKIKLKNDSQIAEFAETGLKFENSNELAADVVVFATGHSNARDTVRKICGDTVADRCKRIWGLNVEGEVNGAWRDLKMPRFGYMIGNLALTRFHSKHVAFQIKAIEECLFGKRYAAEEQ
ncbi:hypothetical protein C8J57DRAFT_1235096 [Mycena rebaudengoi]|nr:hypothetical protein C8J57DRAFT_1235096 [Mycena rebaudengoi]